MSRYSAVIFDLDGTLLNTLDDLADAANYALARMGWPRRTTDEVRRFVGNGVRLLIRRAAPPGSSEADQARCLAIFKERYAAHMEDKTAPYPGIPELLLALRDRGCRTAVVSNKFDAAVKGLCARYFGDLVDAAAGESEQAPKKPDPAMVLLALEKLGIPAPSAVYVGDSDVDIQTARNAGMDCVSVTWGFRDRGFLTEHGAAVFADTPEELLTLLS